ncbi:MAG: hypothetical protein AB8B78_03320 [Polaribacter sp.]
MITDKNQKEVNDDKFTIDDYLKNSAASKYESKEKRMIRTVLDDGSVVVGKRKYDILKKIPNNALLKRQKADIKLFEDYHGITEYVKKLQQNKSSLDSRLKSIQDKKLEAIKRINRDNTEIVFKNYYKKTNGKKFKETKDTLLNLEPLLLYFSKDKRFLNYGVKDDKGNFLSQPSLEKGLCIVGGFGNGKTSIMNTFQRMFIGLDGYSFGRFSTHEVVQKYEEASKHNHPEILERLWKMLTSSELYLDDVKSEPLALVYGKKNLLNSLFQERYNNKKKTHISVNFAKGHNGNVLEALLEFKTKYSNQVYDRIYEMYNIIEFKGKTFRR